MTKDAKQVWNAVDQVINQVLKDSGRDVRTLKDHDGLREVIGLDSLDLAVMVVGLEQTLQIDPFRDGAEPVATVGELVDLYQRSLANDR